MVRSSGCCSAREPAWASSAVPLPDLIAKRGLPTRRARPSAAGITGKAALSQAGGIPQCPDDGRTPRRTRLVSAQDPCPSRARDDAPRELVITRAEAWPSERSPQQCAFDVGLLRRGCQGRHRRRPPGTCSRSMHMRQPASLSVVRPASAPAPYDILHARIVVFCAARCGRTAQSVVLSASTRTRSRGAPRSNACLATCKRHGSGRQRRLALG